MQRQRMNAHKFTNPGLQNRRAPVRLLSHLPENPEFMGVQWHRLRSILHVLIPLDPNPAKPLLDDPRPARDLLTSTAQASAIFVQTVAT